MLLTFSQSHYDLNELRTLLHAHKPSQLLLWQDGVLLPIKYPDVFAGAAANGALNVVALDLDVNARGLAEDYPLKTVSLDEVVTLSEQHFPQLAF